MTVHDNAESAAPVDLGAPSEVRHAGRMESIPEAIRPFVPSIGTVWVWEPMKAHAVAVVTVLDARWNGEEVWLSVEDRSTTEQTMIPLDRWVEATVLVSTPDDPEHGHDFIRTVPSDGRWCRLCGVPEARCGGDACPMHGGAEFVEQRLIQTREQLHNTQRRTP